MTARSVLFVLIPCFLFALTGIASAQERVGDFALLDEQGVFHQLSWYDDRAAVVLLGQVNSCTATDDALRALQSLQSDLREERVKFMLISPM